MPVPRRTDETALVMRPSRDTLRRRPAGRPLVRPLALVLLAALLLLPDVTLAGWTQARRVSAQGGSRLDSLHQLAGSGEALHVVHPRLAKGGGVDRIVHQRSKDQGRTWSREQVLFSSTPRHRHVMPNLAIAARGSSVVVVWRVRGRQGTTLFARTSRDGGASFAPRVAVTSTGPSSGLGVPVVGLAEDVVVVAWTSRGTGDIKVSPSRDEGRSFRPPRTLGRTGMSIECRRRVTDGLVGLAVAGSRLHVAWSVAPAGRCLAERLVLRTSTDGGGSWGATRTLTRRQSYGWPELDARGRSVVATAQLPGGDLLVAHSANARQWTERILKPPKGQVRSAADILIRAGEVWVAYVDMRIVKGKLARSRVAARRSTDGGRSFGPPSTVLASARLLRQAPNLAVQRERPSLVIQSGALSGSPRNLLAVRWR